MRRFILAIALTLSIANSQIIL